MMNTYEIRVKLTLEINAADLEAAIKQAELAAACVAEKVKLLAVNFLSAYQVQGGDNGKK